MGWEGEAPVLLLQFLAEHAKLAHDILQLLLQRSCDGRASPLAAGPHPASLRRIVQHIILGPLHEGFWSTADQEVLSSLSIPKRTFM